MHAGGYGIFSKIFRQVCHAEGLGKKHVLVKKKHPFLCFVPCLQLNANESVGHIMTRLGEFVANRPILRLLCSERERAE